MNKPRRRSLVAPLLIGIAGLATGAGLGLWLQPAFATVWMIGGSAIGILLGFTPLVLPHVKTILWYIAMLVWSCGVPALIGVGLHLACSLHFGEPPPFPMWAMAAVGAGAGLSSWYGGYCSR